MKHPLCISKIDNKTVELEYENGTKVLVKVVKINSRKHALNLCRNWTKKALREWPDAYENIHNFRNDKSFDRLRNYEIEEYLDFLTRSISKYKIDEICPFNGFKWFD